MRRLSRRQWADLRFAHSGVDLSDPTDAFAVALLELVGVDPDVWEHGGESDALDAYTRALNAAVPDHSWATAALDGDANLALEVSICNDLAIPHSTFLAWDERDQDLAIAGAIRAANTCQNGHPREAMTDPALVDVRRTFCAVCAAVEDLNGKFRDAAEEYRRGFSVEVTRVPR